MLEAITCNFEIGQSDSGWCAFEAPTPLGNGEEKWLHKEASSDRLLDHTYNSGKNI